MNFLILFLSLTLQATLSEEIENPLVINYEADLYSDKKELDEMFFNYVYPISLCASLMAAPIFVFSEPTSDNVKYLESIMRSSDKVDITSKPVVTNLTPIILMITLLQCNFENSAIQLVKMSYAESYVLLRKSGDYPDIIGILTKSLHMTVKESNSNMILETILHNKNLWNLLTNYSKSLIKKLPLFQKLGLCASVLWQLSENDLTRNNGIFFIESKISKINFNFSSDVRTPMNFLQCNDRNTQKTSVNIIPYSQDWNIIFVLIVSDSINDPVLLLNNNINDYSILQLFEITNYHSLRL